jgi:hypothetical protein
MEQVLQKVPGVAPSSFLFVYSIFFFARPFQLTAHIQKADSTEGKTS